MDITEVRIRLVESGAAEKLLAFASITLDGEFVVRDMKIIEGNKGLFVAMPSRRIMERCPHCGNKNPLRSRYCNNCGKTVPNDSSANLESDDYQKGHADVAHPITPSCRERIHRAVMKAYDKARESARSGAASGHDAVVNRKFDQSGVPSAISSDSEDDTM